MYILKLYKLYSVTGQWHHHFENIPEDVIKINRLNIRQRHLYSN